MALPTAGSAFGYDILSYNYHVAAAAAAAAASQNSFNGSTHSISSNKSDRSSSGRESRGERERRDSSSRDNKSNASQVDHDKPPFSRVFVVCSKSHSSEDLKKAFEKYGSVEDVWVVRDKHTKENRGVAYVKFSKMSEACLAVESMDGQKISTEVDAKPLKVIIAQPKSSKSTEDFHDESALTRLFVVIPKGSDEGELKKTFETFGDVEYVQIVKDRRTGEKKGFGYVKYSRAYEAALAVENCDKSYKAVMAEPKPSKIKKDSIESPSHQHNVHTVPTVNNGLDLAMNLQNIVRNPEVPSQLGFNLGAAETSRSSSNSIGNRLQVQVSPVITQEQLARLFDLIPGMELCDLKKNYSTGESKGIAVVVYNTVGSAIYAKEKLNGFEYPPGCKLIVRYAPDEEETMIITPRVQTIDLPQQSQVMYCSTQLPSPKPMSDSDSCAERLFIVCHPTPPPDNVLKDVFGRFGNLIDVYMLKNKNFGYAKYSRAESAENAIQTLHGAEVYGKKLKVLQAEPPKGNETSRKRPRT